MPVDPNKKVDLDKLRSVGIGASAVPSRKSAVVGIDNTEKRWSKDFAAYRRLRKEGLQPKRSDGAAKLEATAETRADVEGTKGFEGLV